MSGGPRNRARWRRVKRAAIERDGYRCRACGKASGRFEVDHIVPIAAGGAAFDLENLQTLCRSPCHFAKTTIDRGGVPHVQDAGWTRLVRELLD